jgi:hypothetical protein
MLLKDQYTCTKFFEEAKELGHAVHEVAITAFYTRRQRDMASEVSWFKNKEHSSQLLLFVH